MSFVAYAALMGFVMAAPFGVIGACVALAAMRHERGVCFNLIGGVLLADAIVIGVVNAVLAMLPGLTWSEVQAFAPLWWLMCAGLGGYGVYLIVSPAGMAREILYPARPFRHALLWTVFTNPKNWLGMFAAYFGWNALGMLPDVETRVVVAVAAWAGGTLSWVIWAMVCWKAEAWHIQAEAFAQRLVGWLCVGAAVSAAYTLLS